MSSNFVVWPQSLTPKKCEEEDEDKTRNFSMLSISSAKTFRFLLHYTFIRWNKRGNFKVNSNTLCEKISHKRIMSRLILFFSGKIFSARFRACEDGEGRAPSSQTSSHAWKRCLRWRLTLAFETFLRWGRLCILRHCGWVTMTSLKVDMNWKRFHFISSFFWAHGIDIQFEFEIDENLVKAWTDY